MCLIGFLSCQWCFLKFLKGIVTFEIFFKISIYLYFFFVTLLLFFSTRVPTLTSHSLRQMRDTDRLDLKFKTLAVVKWSAIQCGKLMCISVQFSLQLLWTILLSKTWLQPSDTVSFSLGSNNCFVLHCHMKALIEISWPFPQWVRLSVKSILASFIL